MMRLTQKFICMCLLIQLLFMRIPDTAYAVQTRKRLNEID